MRVVVEPQKGGGTCPDKEGKERFQKEGCNTDPCVVQKGQLLDCESPIDLVLVIDGSASMGEYGWTQSIGAAKHVVKSIKPSPAGSQISVIVYSAPAGWCDFYTCMGTFPEGYSSAMCPPYTEQNPLDCGVKMQQHFTSDEPALLKALDDSAYPALTTFTSYALHAAKDELKLGSPDAQSVVLLFTDGIPNDPKSTAHAATELKKTSRLIIVPVTQHAPLEQIQTWATQPEDVISVTDFEQLDTQLIINDIISTTCPNVTAGAQVIA